MGPLLVLASVALCAAALKQGQRLQSVLDPGGTVPRFLSTEAVANAGELATATPVCGVNLPEFRHETVVVHEKVGSGNFGSVSFAEPASAEMSKLSEKERRTMLPKFVVKAIDDINTNLPPQKINSYLYRENLMGRLLTDAALPETPFAADIGVWKGLDGGHSAIMLQKAGTVELQKLLVVADYEYLTKAEDIQKELQKRTEIAALWNKYIDKVSYIAASSQGQGSPQTSKELHHIAVARDLDGVMSVIQQMLLALLHLDDLSAAHEDIKPANTMLDSDAGTIRFLDYGMADLGIDYFRPLETDPLSFTTVELKKVLPASFKDYRPSCRFRDSAVATFQKLLQHDLGARMGTPRYYSALRGLTHARWFSETGFGKALMGTLAWEEFQAEEKKYGATAKSSPLWNKPATRPLHESQDKFATAVSAMELLLGVHGPIEQVFDAPCLRPTKVAGMSLPQYNGKMAACKSKSDSIAWSAGRRSFAFQKWLANEKLDPFGTLASGKNNGNNNKGDDDDREAEERKEEERASTAINEDVERKRMYSFLYALARQAPIAAYAVGEGLRTEFSGEPPASNSVQRFASDLSGAVEGNRTAATGSPSLVKTIDVGKSACPASLLRELAAKGLGASIRFDDLSPACRVQIGSVESWEDVRLVNNNIMPPTPRTTTRGGPAPVTKISQVVLKPVPTGPLAVNRSFGSSASPPRFLRASGISKRGSESDSRIDEQASAGSRDVLLTSKRLPAFVDSPLGYLFNAPPFIDGKYHAVVPYLATIDGMPTNNLLDFPENIASAAAVTEDDVTSFTFVDTSLVTSLRDKFSFDGLTKADLLLSAEGSPHAKALDLSAKKGTKGILDLLTGLFALHVPRQIPITDAIAKVDQIRLDLYDELNIVGKPKQDLQNHIDCVNTCRDVIQLYRGANDPANDVNQQHHCKRLEVEGVPMAAHCEGVHKSLRAYHVDGVGFTTLVRPSYGITLASFDSLCRANICKKGSFATVPKQLALEPSKQLIEEEFKESEEELLRAIKKEGLKPDAGGDALLPARLKGKVQRLSSADRTLTVVLPIVELNPLIGDGQQQISPSQQQVGHNGDQADQQQKKKNKKQVKIMTDEHDRPVEHTAIFAWDSTPKSINEKASDREARRLQSMANAHKIKIQDAYEDYFFPWDMMLATDSSLVVPPSETIFTFVARKGPVSGRFWTWSFDKYSKNRLLKVFFQRDMGDTSSFFMQPAIQWIRASDKRQRKAMKPRNIVPPQDWFGAGQVRGSAPLYLNKHFSRPTSCAELAVKAARPAFETLRLPQVRDCGSYPNEFPDGLCVCVLLGKERDARVADSVLRLFFKHEENAEIFMSSVGHLLEAALTSSGFRNRASVTIVDEQQQPSGGK